MCLKRLYDRRETLSQAGRILTEEGIACYQRGVFSVQETMLGRVLAQYRDTLRAIRILIERRYTTEK